MNIFAEYIKYHLNSKGRHDIHSPFVFDLLNKGFKNFIPSDLKIYRKTVYKRYLSSKKTILVSDFGAGSKKMGSIRKISNIFKTSSSQGKYADLIYKLSKHFQPKSILELGTSLGVGTFHLYYGNPNTNLVTIEACPETRKVALGYALSPFKKHIQSVEDTFDHYLKTETPQAFDLIFIDGHHHGPSLLNYMEILENWSHDETIFILDDIRWSNDMFEAWNKLIQDDKYHVSIDFFRMGVLVKRTHQQKEHFVLKVN